MATILIVDDWASSREFLVTLLSQAGHHILEATYTEEALRIAHDIPPDLVIADVLLPATDGFEFVRRLRCDARFAHIQVIFYTTEYMESSMYALPESPNMVKWLMKPATPQLILEIIQTTMGGTMLERDRQHFDVREPDHDQLLIGQLIQKVDDLERINRELEQRITTCTVELSDLDRRLRESNAFKDNLLAIASHDLRSPLGSIQNMAEILLEDHYLPDETRHRLLQNIYQSAQRLVDMLRKLLDLSRLESGKIDMELIHLRVSEVIRQTIESLQFMIENKALTIELVIESGEVPVYADWMKLSQILNNLLTNAIKFTLEGGSILVTVGPEPNGIYVSICDTGVGIPADQLSHIFDKFQKVYMRGTINSDIGLGLAIAHQLVKLHGGTIDVTSELKQGSKFIVHLPVKDQGSERSVGGTVD